MATYKLYLGDCTKRMKELPSESVHAIVTDPPYGLEFMGKDWDSFGGNIEETKTSAGGCEKFASYRVRHGKNNLVFQKWVLEWASECLRVLKTGGFLLSFGGTRTHHRLTCGIEDAGFLIRDEICWVYASGFPKAHDLAMMIEKKLGGEGKIVGVKKDDQPANTEVYGGFPNQENENGRRDTIAREPTLPEAIKWTGWKTPALKPAFEPIIIAQKSVKGTIAENVMREEVGGFNIDECRIPYENASDSSSSAFHSMSNNQKARDKALFSIGAEFERDINEKGRYPANLIMTEPCFGEKSKFFLIPKAGNEKHENPFGEMTDKCNHPTVKPVALMKHLIKLLVPRNSDSVILDPFVGSGTTFLACREWGVSCIGIEQSKEYCGIARKRFGKTLGDKLEWIQ